jgi:hypothetical protein
MSVQCVSCKAFSLRGSELAEAGFGKCGFSTKAGSYVSARHPRECERFSAVDSEKERKRREWLDARYAAARRGLKQ